MDFKIVDIYDNKDLIKKSSLWLSKKSGISQDYFIKSMNDCIRNKMAVPRWYVVLSNDEIIGGCGVIEYSDFPIIKYLYLDKESLPYFFNYICDEMKKRRITVLYLEYNLPFDYAKYGWENIENNLYIHKN